METEKEKVIKKINEKLVDYDINNYYCEQDKEGLIIKGKYTIDDYIFKFNNFNSTSLEINKTTVQHLFTQKKEDIIYKLHNMPNYLLANSRNILQICTEELDRYFIDVNILPLFENKYNYSFYRNNNEVCICIDGQPVIVYIKRNSKWEMNILDKVFNCENDKILELKEVSNELLSELNKKKKGLG